MTMLEHVAPDTTVPGVDIVFELLHAEHAIDVRSLKLIGALHRRLWSRRRELLLAMKQSPGHGLETAAGPDQSNHLADLTVATWDERLQQLMAIQSAEMDGRQTVAIRGWSDSEPGVLVDGRAVPGCVFDVAVTLSMVTNELRNGTSPFTLTTPISRHAKEAQLWGDLLSFAEDRLGVERGVVRIS